MADKVLKISRKHVFRLVTNFSGMFARKQTLRAIKFPKNNFTVQSFSRLGTFGVLKNVTKFTSLASGVWLLQYMGKEAICYDGNRISPDAKIFHAARRNNVDEIKRYQAQWIMYNSIHSPPLTSDEAIKIVLTKVTIVPCALTTN